VRGISGLRKACAARFFNLPENDDFSRWHAPCVTDLSGGSFFVLPGIKPLKQTTQEIR